MGGNTESNCAMEAGGVVGGIGGAFAVDAVIAGAVPVAADIAAVGSIFGVAVQASTALGFSTVVGQTAVIGISAATCAGAALLVACIGLGVGVGYGCYYVYTRWSESKKGSGNQPIIEQAISQNPVDQNAILQKIKSPALPQFKPIKMSKAHFDTILSLTQESYRKSLKGLICSVSFQVMRQPYQMKCCQYVKTQDGEKMQSDKCGEKVYIEFEIKKYKRCLMCQSKADESFMIFDQRKYNQILGLRDRLVKVYKLANDEQKKKWKGWIDGQFGQGYTQKYLENFQFTN